MKQQVISSSFDFDAYQPARLVFQVVKDGILCTTTATCSLRALDNLPRKAPFSSALRLLQFGDKWQGGDIDQHLEDVYKSRSGVKF